MCQWGTGVLKYQSGVISHGLIHLSRCVMKLSFYMNVIRLSSPAMESSHNLLIIFVFQERRKVIAFVAMARIMRLIKTI